MKAKRRKTPFKDLFTGNIPLDSGGPIMEKTDTTKWFTDDGYLFYPEGYDSHFRWWLHVLNRDKILDTLVALINENLTTKQHLIGETMRQADDYDVASSLWGHNIWSNTDLTTRKMHAVIDDLRELIAGDLS
jgi:hypothetical protein